MVFSNDCNKLYFTGRGWATSNAIHMVELNTLKIEFITDGNSLELVTSGKYAGNLIIQKHKYWIAGGSYDWYWLVTL